MPLSPFGREIGGTRQYRFLLLIFGVPIYHNTVMNDFGQWYFVHIGDIYISQLTMMLIIWMTIDNDADNFMTIGNDADDMIWQSTMTVTFVADVDAVSMQ